MGPGGACALPGSLALCLDRGTEVPPHTDHLAVPIREFALPLACHGPCANRG